MRLPIPTLLLRAALAAPVAAAMGALAAAPAGAQPGAIATWLRSGQFAEAEAAAAHYADPVARKLVLYARLLTPGAANPAEIADFLAHNPDWPNRALLERRREEAIARESDDAAARTDCAQAPVQLPEALARCAAALASGGDKDAAVGDARRAWASGLAGADQADFLAKWKSVLRPQDELARFDHLMRADPALAAAQIPRLAPTDRQTAKLRLALRHGADDAFARYQKLPKAAQDQPAVLLDALRWLRRGKHDQQAVALWRAKGEQAEREALPAMLPGFWAERNALARQLLADGDNADAYWLSGDTLQQSPETQAASAFLTGFIALRRLSDPKAATADFERLSGIGEAAITQARGFYWLGRAQAAAGQDPRAAYGKAAAFPLTFYGQLAARAAGADRAQLAARIRALADPPVPLDIAWNFAGSELVRAAEILASWGEFGRARTFLLRAEQLSDDPRREALAARLGLALGLPDAAVAIARQMGVQGKALPESGWPQPFAPPPGPLDPAVVLAVMRQESSFDSGIISPAGARGLMQLMPATAEIQARHDGATVSAGALVSDPARNIELGAAYLREMLARFGGSLPLAVAAYNAGPRRVDEWLRQNGDPRAGNVDMVDWIELIPFDETRNYVERVLENVVIYQARRNEPAGTITAQWMR